MDAWSQPVYWTTGRVEALKVVKPSDEQRPEPGIENAISGCLFVVFVCSAVSGILVFAVGLQDGIQRGWGGGPAVGGNWPAMLATFLGAALVVLSWCCSVLLTVAGFDRALRCRNGWPWWAKISAVYMIIEFVAFVVFYFTKY